MINVYKCGLCKGKSESFNRRDLRKHLREEHRIKHNLANNKEGIRRSWWIVEEFP
jgi:hypothetical protein